MSDLEAAWRAFLLTRANWYSRDPSNNPSNNAVLYGTFRAAEEALDAAYAASPDVSKLERALVAAGMAAACCCCGGTSEAQVYCGVVYPKNPQE